MTHMPVLRHRRPNAEHRGHRPRGPFALLPPVKRPRRAGGARAAGWQAAASAAAFGLASAAMPPALAQTWDGQAGDGLWAGPTNWDPDGVPAEGLFSSATFDGAAPGVIDVGGLSRQFGGGLFLNAGQYTFTNGGFQLTEVTGGLAAGDFVFQTTLEGIDFGLPLADLEFKQTLVGNTITIDGANGGLIRDTPTAPTRLVKGPGAFVLTLDGANTHTGGTQINQGVVAFTDDQAFGSGQISTPGGGGQLAPIGDRTIANDLLIDSQSFFDLRIGNEGGGNLTHTGDIILPSSGRGIAVDAGVTYTFQGEIVEPNGPQNLTLFGDGTMVFSGARTFTSFLTIADQLSMAFDHDDAFGSAVVKMDDPGSTLRAIGNRTLANDLLIGGSEDAPGVDFGGTMTLTGTFEAIEGDLDESRIDLLPGAHVTINGTMLADKFVVDDAGTLTLGPSSVINAGQLFIVGDNTVRIDENATLNSVELGTNPDATFVAVGDVVFDDGSISHGFNNAPANYSGVEGGTFTFAAGSAYNAFDGRPKINAIDGADLTFEAGVLNLAGTDRWTVQGDAGSVVTVAGPQNLSGAQTTNTLIEGEVTLRITADDALGSAAMNTIFGNGRDAKLTPVGDRTLANNVNIGASTGDLGDGLGVSGAEGSLTINGTLRSGGEDLLPQPDDGVLKLHDSALVTVNGATTIDDDLSLNSDGTVGTMIFNNTVDAVGQVVVNDGIDATFNQTVTADQVNVNAGGTLRGATTIDADLNINGGTVAPGSSAGTLTVTGAYSQAAASTLAMEVVSAASFDQVAVTGGAALAGAIDLMATDPSQLSLGDTAELLTASAVTGTFETVSGVGLGVIDGFDAAAAITYDPDAVNLTVALFGDANLDQAVNGLDVSALVSNFGGSGTWSTGDFNGDGLINGLDVSALVSNFGAGVAVLTSEDLAALETAMALVPEPGALTLMGLGALGLLRRRR